MAVDTVGQTEKHSKWWTNEMISYAYMISVRGDDIIARAYVTDLDGIRCTIITPSNGRLLRLLTDVAFVASLLLTCARRPVWRRRYLAEPSSDRIRTERHCCGGVSISAWL
jgi:hypothetical protein